MTDWIYNRQIHRSKIDDGGHIELALSVGSYVCSDSCLEHNIVLP